MGEVTWDVAVKKDGSRVWIHEYSGEDVCCPECDGKMIAVRGEIVQHHYRHDSESNCSGESAKHWSKKYEIADALDGLGEVKVEGKIRNFVADVLFERKWAFEVVFSNPPSDDKMIELREKMIIFNFNDENTWYGENHEPRLHQFSHIEPAPKGFSDIVKAFGKAIIANSDVDVCSVCREVKGFFTRFKSEGRCPSCDMDYYKESQKEELQISNNEIEYKFLEELGHFALLTTRGRYNNGFESDLPDIHSISKKSRQEIRESTEPEKIISFSVPPREMDLLKYRHEILVIPKGTPLFFGTVYYRDRPFRPVRETTIIASGTTIEESQFNPEDKTVNFRASIRAVIGKSYDVYSPNPLPKLMGEIEWRGISEDAALLLESLEE